MISGPASTLTPVRLPPGRARLAIRPLAIGSLVIPTIGVGGRRKERFYEFIQVRNDDIGLAAHHLGGQCGKTVRAALGRIPFDNEVAAFAMTQPFQRFVEPPYPERPGGGCELICRNPRMNEGKTILLPRLLRPCDKWPRGSSASDKADKSAPFHLICPEPN
jgi:hypothetical protein